MPNFEIEYPVLPHRIQSRQILESQGPSNIAAPESVPLVGAAALTKKRHWKPTIQASKGSGYPRIPKPKASISSEQFRETFQLSKEDYNKLRSRARQYYIGNNLSVVWSVQNSTISLGEKPRQNLDNAASEVPLQSNSVLIL